MNIRRILRQNLFWLALALTAVAVDAAAPAWWVEHGVLDTNAAANDYAAVNLGQVKQIAKLARDEMEAKLPGGAGTAINTQVNAWLQLPAEGMIRSDYAAVNVGQLKALAKLYYDRLAELSYKGQPLPPGQAYPWTAVTTDDNDYAVANIGQVKYLFSFDLGGSTVDSDNDGLPDWWEMWHFGSLSLYSGTDDPDGDGLSNVQEFAQHSSPNNSDVSPPVVSLTSPGAGATVSGVVNLTATVSDDVGVTAVQFKVDGNNLGGELTAPPYTVAWNTALVSNGSHTLSVVARDAAGNVSVPGPLNIMLTNPGTGYNTAPTVAISGGGGSGATATATMSHGTITGITITEPGTGYRATPTLSSVGGGGTGFGATVLLEPTGVEGVDLTLRNATTNFWTGTPQMTFTGGDGTGVAGTPVMDGIVYRITIGDPGSGYTSRPTVTITGGGGSGAEAWCEIGTQGATAGKIISIVMLRRGTGYTSTPAVNISGGGGSGAWASVYYAKAVVAVNITNPGSGYTRAPSVVFQEGSHFEYQNARLMPTRVASIRVDSSGNGYTSAPTLTFSPPVTAWSWAPLYAKVNGGAVTEVVICDVSWDANALPPLGGHGHTYPPTITFTGSPGSGANATATIANGAINSISVVSGGSGYVPGQVTASSSFAGGVRATATPVLSRPVASLQLTSPGSGYTSPPQVTISGGGGTGAQGVAWTAASRTVTINNIGTPPLITSGSAATFTVGTAGTFTVTASGSPAPTFNAIGLPAWAALNATTGVISGTPPNNTGAPFSVTLTATNNAGTSAPKAFTLNVVNSAAPAITSASSATFAMGQSGSFTVTASGSPTPTFSATGLPAWASLNSATGVIVGTPPNTTGAPFGVTLTATNSAGTSAPQSFTLNVSNDVAPAITSTNSATFVTGQSGSFTVTASGTPVPTFNASGLPSWASLNSATGVISGTPTDTNGASFAVTLTATNSAGTSTPQYFTLNVVNNVAPIITSANSAAFIVGQGGNFVVMASGTPAPTFSASGLPSWASLNSATGVISGTPPDISGAPFTLTLTATNSVGTSAPQSFTLNVATTVAPVITSEDYAIFVAGTSTSFPVTATGAPSPTFSATGLPSWATLDSATGIIEGTPPVDSGLVSVQITANNGILPVATQSLFLSVLDVRPKVTTQPVSTTAVVGQSSGFEVGAAGVNLSYQWRRDGADITGATDGVLTLPIVSLADAGSYQVVVSNGRGTVVSQPATLSVLSPPVIVSQSGDQSVYEGSGVELAIVADGDQPMTYAWSRNGLPISGATASSYYISSAKSGHTGIYSATATNSSGTAVSAPIKINVASAPKIRVQPKSRTVKSGRTTDLYVGATGNPEPVYQWYLNGAPILGATGPSLKAEYEGSYHVVAANEHGSLASNSASVTFTYAGPPLASPQIHIPPTSILANRGDDLVLKVLGTGFPAPTFQWFKNGAPLPGANMSALLLPNADYTDTGSYSVTLTNALSSVTSPAVPVWITAAGGNQTSFEYNQWSFESNEGFAYGTIAGQQNWAVSQGDPADAQLVTGLIQGNATLLLESPTALEVLMPPTIPLSGDITFFDVKVRMKPGAYLHNSRCMIRVGSDGSIQYISAGGASSWSPTGAIVPLDSEGYAYFRLTIRSFGPYYASSFDLWIDGKLILDNVLTAPPYNAGVRFGIPAYGSMLVDDVYLGTVNPLFSDADQDGFDDSIEINSGVQHLSNPRAADLDGDGLNTLQEYEANTDPFSVDTDGDGLPDGAEVHLYHTDPSKKDTDSDGLPDDWEIAVGLNPALASGSNGGGGDPDGDGLTNWEEMIYSTNPLMADTDGDGRSDGAEVIAATDPTVADDAPFQLRSSKQAVGERVFAASGSGPSDKVDVIFAWGDPSSSRSEKWKLVVQPSGRDNRKTIELTNRAFGTVESHTLTLYKGASYTIWLEHFETNRGKDNPDFDWAVLINGKSEGWVPGGWLIDNRSGLLTASSGEAGGTTNLAAGKKVSLTAINLEQVSFSGSSYAPLRSDDRTVTYSAPHWVDSNADGQTVGQGESNYPVTFARNSSMGVSARFSIAGAVDLPISVRASTPFGNIPATAISAVGGGAQLPAVNVNTPNSISLYEKASGSPFIIKWEVSAGSSGWQPLVESEHTIYITYENPISTAASLRCVSLFSIGCRNAEGHTQQGSAVGAIFSQFAGREVRRSSSGGGNSAVILEYWGAKAMAEPLGNTVDILTKGDGRCEAWSRFFIDILRAQGINAEQIDLYQRPIIFPGKPANMLPEDWYATNLGQDTAARLRPFNVRVTGIGETLLAVKSWGLGNLLVPQDLPGIPGQGNNDPISVFSNHVVVRCSGAIFDPSYGTTFPTLEAWENGALDAIMMTYKISSDVPGLPNVHPLIARVSPGYKMRTFIVKPQNARLTIDTLDPY